MMIIRFKQLTLSLLFIGFSASALAQPILVKTDQNVEEYKLENGFRILLAPNDKENKVFMNTVYMTGSLNDPKGKGGLAHLLEHLAFKGTENVKGEEFQRRLDQYTLMTNASTGYYSTKYTNVIRPEKNAINEMIYLEAERMDKLVLQEKFVPSEINIVMREREVRMDQPFAVLIDKIWKSAYGNQYLGRLPIGDLAELKSINMNELNAFYKAWYAPNNAVMVIAGKFDKTEVLKQIDQRFSAIPARALPAQANVPMLDVNNIKPRNFLVQKGSDLAKFNIYLTAANEKIKPALMLSPSLFTMQPSGHLYQSMVETGISTAVDSTTWIDRDFNLVLMGAIYAPSHDAEKVGNALNQGVEQNKGFNDVELNRVKNLIQNQAENIISNSSALGSQLSDYYVSENGNWVKFFEDLNTVKQLKVQDVNKIYQQFFTAEHRLTGDIQPTPEDQKKAVQQTQSTDKLKTLDQQTQQAEPMKDVNTYRQEVATYVKSSQQNLVETEKQIIRGQLKNGMKFALFPTKTQDDKTYASISIDFGTAKSLFNQSEILDLTSYLLLRASEQYSLQDIADKSIEAGGVATASADTNGMTIQIVAKKEKFDDFFKFIVSVMKAPKFEQSQFDLIKSQSLANLDRPYTEPETVASLTISRLLETYQPGDLRYHFEPEYVKQQLNVASNEKVKALYQQFFAMNNASIAVTGEFDAKKMQKLIQKEFSNWNGQQPNERVIADYHVYPAQKVHALSEQREFGSYEAFMPFPVGTYHTDAPALIVLSHILGNSQLSSRLAQELREKNALVYGFGSSVNLGEWNDSGALTISAKYTAGKSDQVSQAVSKVLQDLLKNGVTEQELEASKADIMKKRVTSLEDSRNVHRMLLPQLEHDRTMADREVRDSAIAKLTKADMDAVIQKYIKLDHLVEVSADQYGKPQK